MGKTRCAPSKSERRSAGGVGLKSKITPPSSSSLKTYTPNTSNTFTVPSNLTASGRIQKRKPEFINKKNKKKLQSNLSDLIAAGGIVQTTEKIKSKLGKKFADKKAAKEFNSSITADLLANCTNSGMKKIIKASIPGKKDRIKIKREAFQKKIQMLKKSEKEKLAETKRKQTVIVGDVQPMLKALESEINSLQASGAASAKTCIAEQKLEKGRDKRRKTNKISMRMRQEEIAQGLEYFAQGLSGKLL